jgi:hypothetical protein
MPDELNMLIPIMPIIAATPDSILPINNSPAAIAQVANPVMRRNLITAMPSLCRIASGGLRVSPESRPHGLFSGNGGPKGI